MTQEEQWLLKEKYQDVESEAFHADCARLAVGEPLGYVIGHVPFLDCKIYLDSHPLIPRVETEFWVEQAIGVIANYKKSTSSVIASEEWQYRFTNGALDCFVSRNDGRINILDLCAGSGAIGVAVAKAVTKAEMTFAEIDPAHLPTIEKNFARNIAINRDISGVYYKILQSDLFENVFGQFDFILSNPPYIDADTGTVETSVTEHEPHLALFGGCLGLELISRIIVEAPTHLTTTGQLWLEHEPEQVEAITALAKQNGLTITTHHDQYKIPRFSVLSMAQ